MADSQTSNYQLLKPEPGASRDTWGAKLNLDWDTVDAIMAALMPVGAVVDFAGTTAPSGWLLCDGTSYPISTYPKLAAVLGNRYGGDGSTTFAVPDCRGRVTAGVGSTLDQNGVTAGFGLGDKLGFIQWSITADYLPNATVVIDAAGDHTHTGVTDLQGQHGHGGSTDAQGAHTHTASGSATTDSQGDHSHTYSLPSIPAGSGFAAGANISMPFGTGTTSVNGAHAHNVSVSVSVGSAGNHAHNITTTSDGNHGHVIGTAAAGAHAHTGHIAGSSVPIPLYQPLIALNRIIFAGPPGFTTLSTPLVGAPALMQSPMRGPG